MGLSEFNYATISNGEESFGVFYNMSAQDFFAIVQLWKDKNNPFDPVNLSQWLSDNKKSGYIDEVMQHYFTEKWVIIPERSFKAFINRYR